MQITCKAIKENARIRLKGKWAFAFLCTFLWVNFSDAVKFITDKFHLGSISIILILVSTAVFLFGYNDIILQITRGNNIKFLRFFSGCKRTLRGFRMSLLMGVYILLWSILLVIPGIIAMIKYSMTFFVWVDNPDIYISEAISKSVDITYGHKFEIFKLILSFIGWFLLVIALTLGIEFIIINYTTSNVRVVENISYIIGLTGLIILETYVNVSMGVLYNKLIESNKSEDNMVEFNEKTRQLN